MAQKTDVTVVVSEDDLQFLIRAMRFLRGGPYDQKKNDERWEALFTQALGKHFDERPAHAMDDNEEAD